MITKFFSFLLLLSIVYVLAVFIKPDFSDKYGNPEINRKIRLIKDASLNFASGSENPLSLYEKIKSITQSTKEDATSLYETIQTTYSGIESQVGVIQSTLSGKVQEVKNAAESVENAYNALEAAKNDVKKVISLSGTTNP